MATSIRNAGRCSGCSRSMNPTVRHPVSIPVAAAWRRHRTGSARGACMGCFGSRRSGKLAPGCRRWYAAGVGVWIPCFLAHPAGMAAPWQAVLGVSTGTGHTLRLAVMNGFREFPARAQDALRTRLGVRSERCSAGQRGKASFTYERVPDLGLVLRDQKCA